MKKLLTILLSLIILSCTTPKPSEFDLEQILSENAKITSLESGAGFDKKVLKIIPDSIDQGVVIWQGEDTEPWENAKYLICEIWHQNKYSAVINLEFYRKNDNSGDIVAQSGSVAGGVKEKPRMSAKIGVLPKLKTKVIFPLQYLDGQNIFMPRYPRQLKGTVLGNRLKPEDISKVAIRFGPYLEPYFKPEFELAAVYLSDELPEPFPKPENPVVDELGQWAQREWPGKTESEEELKTILEKQLSDASTSSFPDDWSKYGGWKKKKFEATGFFRTHHDGKRWWLADPEGYAFVSVGIDCIRDRISGTVSGQEDLFKWLPDSTDQLFKDAYSDRRDELMFDFYQSNLMRAFEENWRENWETLTAGQIRQFGINTIGNWSDLKFARKSKIPYVLPLSGFPSTQVKLYRDFPDVFSEEYAKNAKQFAQQLETYKNDRYLIGYFLSNEPHWAFGANDVAFEMFGTNQQSESKNMFPRWLSQRYSSINELNKTWNTQLDNFEAITQLVLEDYPSKNSKDDFMKFSELLVEKYVSVPCDEVEKIDPNHLNLGMRYAMLSSDLLYKAGERFDVFSINGYANPGPPETYEIARISGKPVMIGEFHFGAVDRGLPATGIQGALSQEARGKAYRYYIEQGLARPELIGMHYFQWLDQPICGRFDGENYNIGFMDICNSPYQELTDAAIETHKRMYEVATGLEKPYSEMIEKIPPIHY